MTVVLAETVAQVVTEVHVAMTEAQEVHVVTVVMHLLKTTSRTTSRRCSKHLKAEA
jgi:hypothetical protein